MQEVVVQWVWRIVATLAIVASYHIWRFGYSTSSEAPDIGSRLQDEWRPQEEEEEQEEDLTAAAQKRSALLDRLEEEAKNKDILDDAIENDDDEEEILVREEEAPAEPTDDELISQDPPTTTPSQQPPLIKAKSCHHPGLDGFRRWYEVQASLYRIYTVGRTDDVVVHPPFMPKSERGHVSLKLNVTNNYRRTISVYWINYTGKEVHKGNVVNGSVFTQTTWIGHPWTFRDKDTQALLCHYIPYKIIPTTHQVPTVDSEEPELGIHQFAILSLGQRRYSHEHAICCIADPAFPTVIETAQDAAAWSFQEMARLNYGYMDTINKYFTNIVRNPAETKYRQIRIAHVRFQQQIWNTPARGLFLAAGFVEEGAYAELGCAQDTLSRDRVQELSTLLFYMERWKKIMEMPLEQNQPEGADGHGRANFK